jgi:hypothetical protein
MKKRGKANYRNFAIEVSRVAEGGYSMSTYRNNDGWILVDEWNPCIKTVEDAIEECKITIDDYYINPEDYED